MTFNYPLIQKIRTEMPASSSLYIPAFLIISGKLWANWIFAFHEGQAYTWGLDSAALKVRCWQSISRSTSVKVPVVLYCRSDAADLKLEQPIHFCPSHPFAFYIYHGFWWQHLECSSHKPWRRTNLGHMQQSRRKWSIYKYHPQILGFHQFV